MLRKGVIGLKMKKIILLFGITMILLINIVNARGGGAAYPCDDTSYWTWFQTKKISNEIANIHALTKGIGFMMGCFPNGYNFGKVTYHEKAISETHWY